MDQELGGLESFDKIFATELPGIVKNIEIKTYDENDISKINQNINENGFSFIIIPASSKVHSYYAQNAPDFDNIFMRPVIGWISGVHLNDLGKITPKVFNGRTLEVYENKAVLMNCALPPDKMPIIGIINLFSQGNGDIITFTDDSFSVKDCKINGVVTNFYDYITKNKIDTKLPLVSDYSGAMVNVSFQSLNEKDKSVSLYAPVFKDVEYKIAKPVSDYVNDFSLEMKKNSNKNQIIFTCNCILNYLYAELKGKNTIGMSGPITFGEIAYQLLNQTLVYLEIKGI